MVQCGVDARGPGQFWNCVFVTLAHLCELWPFLRCEGVAVDRGFSLAFVQGVVVATFIQGVFVVTFIQGLVHGAFIQGQTMWTSSDCCLKVSFVQGCVAAC